MGRIIDRFLFFSTDVSEGSINLDKEETRHAHSVLRLQNEDTIFITDGKGRIYSCVIEHIEKESCRTKILKEKVQELPKPAMHFFIGLTEKEPFEAAIMGLVPLGVMHVTPLECDNCQNKWWIKKWEKHRERFRNKMIAAAKQSWNAWLPTLNIPVKLDKAIGMLRGIVFIADMNGETLDKSINELTLQDTISCFIGPPEGFSQQELDALKQSSARLVKLADRRLRTELAATVFAGNIVQKFLKIEKDKL
jgi:16S rRNA (uracil1498-N3)-methyltransferase